MNANCLEKLQSLFENARNDLQNLKAKLDTVQSLIDDDKLIPDSLSDEVQDMLSTCRNSKAVLTDTVEKYAISEEMSLTDMEKEIAKTLAVSEIRRLLVDYFRLTSEADTVLAKLNEAKQELKEKCKLPQEELQAVLTPYQIVVDYVSGKTSEISDEQSELIEDVMGRTVSRAIDKGQISFGDVSEGEKWLEGIDEFASAISSEPDSDIIPEPVSVSAEETVQDTDAETFGEPVENPVDEPLEETVNTVKDPVEEPTQNTDPEEHFIPVEKERELPKLWPDFSDYIPDKAVDFKDVSAKNLKISDFRNLLRKKPATPDILQHMINAKLFPLNATSEQYSTAALDSRAVIDGLIKKGYIAIAAFVESDGKRSEYAHITSMGYEALYKFKKEKSLLPVFKRWTAEVKKPVVSDLYLCRCKRLRDWIQSNLDVTDTDAPLKIACADQDPEYVFSPIPTDDDDSASFVVPALFEAGKEQKWVDIITEAMEEYKDRCDVTILVSNAEDISCLRNAICSAHPEYEERIRFCDMSKAVPEKESDQTSVPDAEPVPDPIPAEPVQSEPTPDPVSSKEPEPEHETHMPEITDAVSPLEIPVPAPETAAATPSPAPKKRDIDIIRSKIVEYEKKAYEAFKAERQDVGSVILKSLCLETVNESGLEDEYLRLSQLEERYAFATGNPMLSKDYRASNLQTAFNMPYGKDEAYDALAIAAFLRMYFSSDAGIEAYGAANLQFANNIALKNDSNLNDLIYQLTSYVKESFTGIDSQVLSMAFKHENVNEKLADAQKIAQDWCVGNRLLSSSHSYNRIIENRKLLFGAGTVLRTALETVASNDVSNQSAVKQAMSLIENRIAPKNVDQLMDEVWDETAHSKDKAPLIGVERTTLTKQLFSIFHALEDWLHAAQLNVNVAAAGSSATQKAVSIAHTKLSAALNAIDQEQNESASAEVLGARKILKNTVSELLERFDTPDAISRVRDSYYIRLLEYPLVAVQEGFIPYIEVPAEETSEFNFCERVCEYLNLPHVEWPEVIARLFKKDSDRIGGDYGCASVLHDYLELYETLDIWPTDYANVERFAEEAKSPKNKAVDAVQAWQQDFQGRLDMADGDEWFREPDEHKRLEKIINEQKRAYYFSNNFGFYGRAMLRVLENMFREAEQLRSEYESQLKSAQAAGSIPADAPIYALAEKMIGKNRFGAFRSYLQMAERDETDVTESRLSNQQSYFAKFCMQCSDLCSKTRSIGVQTLLSVYNKYGYYRENATGKTARSFMQNWMESDSTNVHTQAEKVKNIVEALGIQVDKPVSEGTGIHLTLKNPGRVISYPHPIADFGSRMYANGLQVQALYGNLLPADVLFTKVREILQKNKQQSFLILVNCAIPLDERRKFAKLVAESMVQSPFIIVDRALALFLTGIPQAERWKAMLQCALPFQVINPYSENSAVEIPPEMFIGRTNELESIRRPDGANLIYGGRQLGKTALLKRARVLEHQPAENSWAVYEDIKTKKSSEASARIAKTLTQENFFKTMPEVSSWSELLEHVEDRLMGNEDKLLLLLDEADAFLLEAGRNNYGEIDDLKRLQDRTNHRFKCVMAGLHNVLRINNTKALTNNSSLAHLQGLTVEPLDFKDARDLLEIPLSYLGFTIPEEDEDIITQILYNTNYFPGLVHFYASRLVKYAKTHSIAMKEPPYELKTETLLSLLAEQDFHDLRNDRIRMTLYIDANEHSYYDILATTMCYGYNNSDEYKFYGMTVADIRAECTSLEPNCSIAQLDDTQLKALLDELVALNIFREENGHYQFRRTSFTEIFSSPEDVESHFLEILTREAN